MKDINGESFDAIFPSLGSENDLLDDESRQKLRRSVSAFEVGDCLTLEGDQTHGVVCVLSGWLTLSKSLEDGQVQIIDFILPGDLAFPSAADGESAALQVEAQTDVQVIILKEEAWTKMQARSPALQRRAGELAAAAQARVSERMLRLGKGSAAMRIAYALLELGIRARSLDGRDGQSFHIPLTQQRLADFVGLTPVHVSRTLSTLQRHEIISTDDHMDIAINDLEALSELAGVDLDSLRQQIEPQSA